MSRITRPAKTFATTLAASISGVLVALITTYSAPVVQDERCGAYRVAVERLATLALFDFRWSASIQVLVLRVVGRNATVPA